MIHNIFAYVDEKYVFLHSDIKCFNFRRDCSIRI